MSKQTNALMGCDEKVAQDGAHRPTGTGRANPYVPSRCRPGTSHWSQKIAFPSPHTRAPPVTPARAATPCA
jgi:hypothetical protein